MRLAAKTVKLTPERRRMLRRQMNDRRTAVRWELNKAMRRSGERRGDFVNPWGSVRKR
jgi:hypothetical protein